LARPFRSRIRFSARGVDIFVAGFKLGQFVLKAACDHVVRELISGVQHGFSEIVITVETVQSKKKSITIKSGKSHRFTVYG